MALLRFAFGISLIMFAVCVFFGIGVMIDYHNPSLLFVSAGFGGMAIMFRVADHIVELLTSIRDALQTLKLDKQ